MFESRKADINIRTPVDSLGSHTIEVVGKSKRIESEN